MYAYDVVVGVVAHLVVVQIGGLEIGCDRVHVGTDVLQGVLPDLEPGSFLFV